MKALSITFYSHSLTHSPFRSLFLSFSLILNHILALGKNRVSPISREDTNPPRDNRVLARPRPNFDLKFSSWLYPKIYIHIYGRCIRNATVLTAYSSIRGFREQTGSTAVSFFSYVHRFLSVERDIARGARGELLMFPALNLPDGGHFASPTHPDLLSLAIGENDTRNDFA